TLLEHGTDDLLYAEICRRQIRAEHSVPVGTLHAHYELIACNPGVVDQDVDLAELGKHRFTGGLDLRFIADVNREGRSFPACPGNFPYQFIKLLLIARRQGDRSPCTRQLQRATPPNSLRRAGDQRNSAGNIHGFSSGAEKPELYAARNASPGERNRPRPGAEAIGELPACEQNAAGERTSVARYRQPAPLC